MPNVIIYHNPSCSKSRQSLALLRQHKIEPTIIEYLKTPPTVQELTNILHLLQLTASDIVRRKEQTYDRLKDTFDESDQKALLKILVKHPILIERPIIVHDDKAVIGRPPEKLLEII